MSAIHSASGALEPVGPSRLKPKLQFVLIVASEVAFAFAVLGGLQWWRHGRFVQTTNDAYLQADQVTIAPKVQGYVEQVFVGDNQHVVAGQPLVRIDKASYNIILAQQAAALDAQRADIEAFARQVAQQRAVVLRAKADLTGARADAAYAGGEADRVEKLTALGVETRQRAAQARDQASKATASVRSGEAAIVQAEEQVATLQAQQQQVRAQVAAAEAQLRTAQLNLDDTLIRASVDGEVGDRSVRVGQFVQPGTRLMTLVPVRDIYLVANFKETQVDRIRVGQVANVKVDALRGPPIQAVVDSFAPGTGAQFALLPSENATGNFTKVVQRIPIRLQLRDASIPRDHLLPGLSATVRIDTTRPPIAAHHRARS